jgi:hypothetical protein
MKARGAVVAASLVVAASVVVSVMIHRPLITCSRLAGSAVPCPQHDYPLVLRLGIVAAGLVVAVLVVIPWGNRLPRERSHGR